MARMIFRSGNPVEPRALTYFSELVMEALRQIRLALGTGTVFFGFDVRERPGEALLEISPGLAFDGAGQPVALESPLRLPFPDEDGPLWLALRHHLLVDEEDLSGRPTRERDSVEVVWLSGVPRSDDTIPIARLQRGPAGWLIDASVARRSPSLSHRHTGATLPDRSGRLRYDGAPVRLTLPGGEPAGQPRLEQLEAAVSAEFDKLNTLLGQLSDQGRLHEMELSELRSEVAEVAERAVASPGANAGDDEEWRGAIATMGEELAFTLGDEVREELEILRAEVAALATRPTGMGPDPGGFTPVQALHGIGDKSARALREAGVETVSDLLAATSSPEGRERLEATRLSPGQLRRWSREADLLRLHGVGPAEAALLQRAGVSSSADLALCEAAPLYSALRKLVEEQGEGGAPPMAWVESWIRQAQHLPPVVEW